MGTRSVTATEVSLTIKSTIRNTLTDGQVAQCQLGKIYLSGTLANGVGEDQVNRGWEDRDREITSGNTEDIDLYDFAGEDVGAGSGKDALGQACAFEEIVTFMVKQTGGTGRLEIMPANPANHATWVPSLTVANGGALKSGGMLLMHQPDTDAFDIADGSSHVIRLGANGGDVTYDIMILARHDDDESSSSSSPSSSTSSTSSTSSSSESSSSPSSTSSSSTSSPSSSSSSTSSTSSLSSSSVNSSSSSPSSLSSSSSSQTV